MDFDDIDISYMGEEWGWSNWRRWEQWRSQWRLWTSGWILMVRKSEWARQGSPLDNCKQFKEVRVVFPSDSLEVYVICAGNRHPFSIHSQSWICWHDKSAVYRWTKAATETILTGIKNNARPKVILRNCNILDAS